MAVYFFDTSALVKRYAPENGTKWVQTITAPAARHRIYIARITGAEVIAAIRLNVREGETSEADAAKVIVDFRLDFTNQYTIHEVTEAVVNRAMGLIEKHTLKAYDGVQLATAVEINDDLMSLGGSAIGVPAVTIISADKQINRAAADEGLVIENPDDHPHPADLVA